MIGVGGIWLLIKQRTRCVTMNVEFAWKFTQFLNLFFLSIEQQIFVNVRNHCIAQISFKPWKCGRFLFMAKTCSEICIVFGIIIFITINGEFHFIFPKCITWNAQIQSNRISILILYFVVSCSWHFRMVWMLLRGYKIIYNINIFNL